MLTVEINSRRGIVRHAAVGRGDGGAEQDEDVPVRFAGSHALLAAEERGGMSNMERGLLVFRIEFLRDEQFSPGWHFPWYRKGGSSCPEKGHLGG